MTTRIFVHTPFQVICAGEFIAARKMDAVTEAGEDIDLVLFVSRTDANSVQTRETARRLGLTFRTIGDAGGATPWHKLRRFAAFRRETRELSGKDMLVVGNPGLAMFATALSRARCEKWVLDDGFMTVRYFQSMITGGAGWPGMPESFLGRLLTQGVFGQKKQMDWRSMKWFSIFARYYPELPMVHQNTLAELKRKSRFAEQDRSVVFLGSPLVTHGIFSSSTYEVLCREAASDLRKKYPGCSLVYLRHRSEREMEHCVHRYFDVVEQSTGPIELRWLDSGKRVPVAISGVMSTALISLAELLPSQVHVFWPGQNVRSLSPHFDPMDLLPFFEKVSGQGRLTVRRVGEEEE